MAGFLTLQVDQDTATVKVSDDWQIENIRELEAALAQLDGVAARQVKVDFSQLGGMDLSGAWLLKRRLQALEQQGSAIDPIGPPAQFDFIGEILAQNDSEEVQESRAHLNPVLGGLAWIGHRASGYVFNAKSGLAYFGELVLTGAAGATHPRRFRLPSVVRHIYETGIQAIPIVGLIALLISVIVAYLGAQQLQKFGAEIFTVDLVAISVLREMGVLLTAIMVAGRSGSAFAAEIGVMRLNEEVDALRSIGVNIFEVLVLPRVLGLLVALPLLTIIADACGLLGGGILSSLLLGIGPGQYIARVQDSISPTTFWAGLIKAPVFAILIAIVGTQRGMEVRDSSRELGRLTTVAVVQAIFLVILADAIFAIVFVQLDF